MDNFISRFKKRAQKIGEILEMVMAVIVLFGILLSIYSLVKDFEIFQYLASDTTAFKPFLEAVFVIVIGIEFFQMLCRPNSDNVMEVLIFLVARHMILGDTTPVEDFVSVVSVGILCVLRRYLHVMKEKEAGRARARQNEQDKGQEREAAQSAGQEEDKSGSLISAAVQKISKHSL